MVFSALARAASTRRRTSRLIRRAFRRHAAARSHMTEARAAAARAVRYMSSAPCCVTSRSARCTRRRAECGPVRTRSSSMVSPRCEVGRAAGVRGRPCDVLPRALVRARAPSGCRPVSRHLGRNDRPGGRRSPGPRRAQAPALVLRPCPRRGLDGREDIRRVRLQGGGPHAHHGHRQRRLRRWSRPSVYPGSPRSCGGRRPRLQAVPDRRAAAVMASVRVSRPRPSAAPMGAGGPPARRPPGNRTVLPRAYRVQPWSGACPHRPAWREDVPAVRQRPSRSRAPGTGAPVRRLRWTGPWSEA